MRQNVTQDVERMIKFMKHEVSQKIDELKAKANEEYKTEKKRIIEENTSKLQEEYTKKRKELGNKRVTEKSNLLRKSRMLFLKEKEEIINNVFAKVNDKLKKCKLTESMVKKTPNLGVIYCLEKDVSTVKRVFNDVQIKLLNDSFVGGIISTNADNTIIHDNSFLMRLNIAKEKYMKYISNFLFKENN
ncbi:hypothetical protein H311_03217 [Anncaliia algerae PRA109]|nr:hypothetical protein H311_03217 [Anncaliia algerae PRA109]